MIAVSLRWFTLRQIAMFGACAFIAGWGGNIFVPNAFYMIFTNGILIALGWSVVQTSSYIVFNSYFVEKRVMMMGICMSIVGIGPIAMPYIIEALMNEYGFRATVALITAICANALVGTALYQPVKWHLVPAKIEQG
jgi:MFS family permease